VRRLARREHALRPLPKAELRSRFLMIPSQPARRNPINSRAQALTFKERIVKAWHGRKGEPKEKPPHVNSSRHNSQEKDRVSQRRSPTLTNTERLTWRG